MKLLQFKLLPHEGTKARLRKIEDIETLPKVRDANWRIEIHGWKKRKE